MEVDGYWKLVSDRPATALAEAWRLVVSVDQAPLGLPGEEFLMRRL
jgi:hypothetical protein